MFVSLDLETTGFDPTKDKIIEFGAIKFDLQGNQETLQFLCNPGFSLPEIITHITGIKDKQLKDKGPFEDKIKEVKEFIGGYPIIGHNIQFDINFLIANDVEIDAPSYDTCQLASILLPSLPSYSLEILSKQLDLKHEEKHRALDDSIAAMELFLKLKDKFEELPEELLEKIKSLCPKTNWPLARFLEQLSGKSPTSATNSSPEPRKEKEYHPLSTELTAKLLDIDEKALIEIAPPYDAVVHTFVTQAHPNSYLALSANSFHEFEDEISDDVAKIDSSDHYLSLTRLQKFENKEFFEEHEFSALLKYLIWSKQSKTGLLSEVTLLGREKSTLYEVNIDKSNEDFAKTMNDELFYKKALHKDETKPAICTHKFIIENQNPIDDLIILNLEKFTRELFYYHSTYLKVELLLQQLENLKTLTEEKSLPLLEGLENKTTILFGLIGILHEKYNDQNEYTARTILSEQIQNSKEWLEIRNSINNLIETSKELGAINNDKTAEYLKNWKNLLLILQNSFLQPDFSNTETIIEEDFQQNMVLRGYPRNLRQLLQKLLENCKNYKIIDENLDLNDEGKFIKTLWQLDQNITITKAPSSDNLNILVVDDIPQTEFNDQTLLNLLSKVLTGNSAIIVNSKQKLQHFTLKLSQKVENLKIVSQLTGSLGKITEQFKEDPENSVLLLTPNNWENFKDHHLINTLYMHKLPFEPPSDIYLTILSENFSDPFSGLQIPRTTFSLSKILNHLKKDGGQNKTAILLDSRLSNKGYGQEIAKHLSNLGQTQNILSNNLLN